MKKTFTMTVLLSAFIGLRAFAQVPTDGLVSYYPFSGNANDASANGNNGTVYGATLTTDRFGNANSAYSFDGINNYISLPPTNLLNLNTYSYSIWAKPISTPGIHGSVIFEIGGASNINTGDGYGQTLTCEPEQIFFGGSYNIGSNPIQSTILSNPSALNKWYHLVLIRNSTTIKLYINGVMVNSTSTALTNAENADYGGAIQKNAIIGGRCFLQSSYFFPGVIDDFRIYNRDLDQTEVTALYNEVPNTCTRTVTDTLVINANITGFNPITYQNNIKVYPNPTNDKITIDCGSNFSTMNGYSIKITNSLSQSVYNELVNKQTTSIDLKSWTGKGIYFVHLIDGNSNTIDIKKIVLQ